MTDYLFPYEVIKSKGGAAFTKVGTTPDDTQSYRCCQCNEPWPSVCQCPSTQEENKERSDAFLADYEARRAKWAEYWGDTWDNYKY